MIAKEDRFAMVHDMIQTFARIGTVAYDIPQAKYLVDVLIGNMRKHGLKCFEIAMNITDDRAFHGQVDFPKDKVTKMKKFKKTQIILRQTKSTKLRWFFRENRQEDSLGRSPVRVKRCWVFYLLDPHNFPLRVEAEHGPIAACWGLWSNSPD